MQTTAAGQAVIDFRNNFNDTDVIPINDPVEGTLHNISKRLVKGVYDLTIEQLGTLKHNSTINLGDNEYSEIINII